MKSSIGWSFCAHTQTHRTEQRAAVMAGFKSACHWREGMREKPATEPRRRDRMKIKNTKYNKQ